MATDILQQKSGDDQASARSLSLLVDAARPGPCGCPATRQAAWAGFAQIALRRLSGYDLTAPPTKSRSKGRQCAAAARFSLGHRIFRRRKEG